MVCYQANIKRNVHDQNFDWGGKDGEWGGGNSERFLKWVGGGHKRLFIGGGGTEGTTTLAHLKF